MYEGYLSLGGTEIINEERTGKYIRTLAPNLGLTGNCCRCDSIGSILGEVYDTPLADEPAWFSTFRPESLEFMGLLPLAFRGFDDSTRQVGFTEAISDGAVAGRPRMAGRTLRVSALMIGLTQKGLDYGMAWLRDALAGSDCDEGACTGDDLCFLANCPDLCDDPLTETILDLDYANGSTLDDALWQNPTGLEPVVEDGVIAWEPVPSGWEASVVLDGLTPGATYRVDVSLPLLTSEPPTGSTAIVGIAGLEAGTKVWGLPFKGTGPDSSGAVFEFVAAYSSHRLVITPTYPPGSWARLEVESVLVTRVARQSIVLTTWPWAQFPGEQYAWSFGPTVPNTITTWFEPHQFAWFGTAPFSAGVGSLYTERTLTGLRPGRRYRLRTYARVGKNNITGPYSVSITTGDEMTVGAHGWLTHEFTATDQSMVVRVGNGDAFTGSFDSQWSVSPYYLRLEEVILDEVEPVVEQGVSMRIFREVTVVDGPTVMEVFPTAQGHFMQRVEWTMGVGVPRPFAPSLLVTDSLGPGGVLVPEVECVNGQAEVHNMLTNPSFETGTASWAAVASGGGTVGLTNPSTSFATGGTRVAQVTLTGAGAGWCDLQTSTPLMLAARQQYTISADLRASFPAQVQFRAMSTDGNWRYDGPIINLPPDAPMRRASMTFSPAPYYPGDYRVVIRMLGTAAEDGHKPVVGDYMQVDRAMLSARPYDGVYVDGSVPGGSWDGAANASTSTWTNPVPETVVDPDCPPPPLPPRPPVIIDDCALPSSQWTRHTIDIPARLTQQGVVAYPVITLTTGDLDARGVRVRLAANPNRRDPSELDPCDYCGEFLLTYLPANASLVVDAGTRQVTVVSPIGETSGRHLLTGTNGDPVTWPEMTCGVPYVLFVDLDTNTDPLVNLSVSITPAY